MIAPALTLILQLCMTTAAPAAATELANEVPVRQYCWTLLQQARYGYSTNEAAAFVVRDPDGDLSFVQWPSSELPHEARWVGAYPRGTVAILHTHPNWSPEPSHLDARAARSRRVPVYVVTRMRISKTTGAETQTVVNGDWRAR